METVHLKIHTACLKVYLYFGSRQKLGRVSEKLHARFGMQSVNIRKRGSAAYWVYEGGDVQCTAGEIMYSLLYIKESDHVCTRSDHVCTGTDHRDHVCTEWSVPWWSCLIIKEWSARGDHADVLVQQEEVSWRYAAQSAQGEASCRYVVQSAHQGEESRRRPNWDTPLPLTKLNRKFSDIHGTPLSLNAAVYKPW